MTFAPRPSDLEFSVTLQSSSYLSPSFQAKMKSSLRLIVVGDGTEFWSYEAVFHVDLEGVGKTTLITSFLKEVYEPSVYI